MRFRKNKPKANKKKPLSDE
jgi:hypothetical protein